MCVSGQCRTRECPLVVAAERKRGINANNINSDDEDEESSSAPAGATSSPKPVASIRIDDELVFFPCHYPSTTEESKLL